MEKNAKKQQMHLFSSSFSSAEGVKNATFSKSNMQASVTD